MGSSGQVCHLKQSLNFRILWSRHLDAIKFILQMDKDGNLSVNLTLPTEGSMRCRCVALSLAFFLTGFYERRDEYWQVFILVGLKEVMLLSGSDP